MAEPVPRRLRQAPSPQPDAQKSDARKPLLRLIRFLLGSRAASATGHAEPSRPSSDPAAVSAFHVRPGQPDVLVTRADGETKSFAAETLRHAASLGLVTQAADAWHLLATARPFLKRALCAPDEAFAGQHRMLETDQRETADGRQTVTVNLAESPLSVVARLKEKSGKPFLPAEAIEAGQRLHRDFTRAQLQPRLTMSFEPRLATRTKGQGGGGEMTDSAVSARSRVARAMEAIGPELCGVAIDVCGFEKGLEIVERERQWPARSAKLMLRTALMALSRHYAPPPPDRRYRHAWGSEGYRPSLDGGPDRRE